MKQKRKSAPSKWTDEAIDLWLRMERPDLELKKLTRIDSIAHITIKACCGHILTVEFLYLKASKSRVYENGCVKCYARKAPWVSKGNHKDFVASMRKQFPHLKVVGTYVNRTTRIKFRCTDCGETFQSTPSWIEQCKHGCWVCSKLRSGYARKNVTVEGKQFSLQGFEPLVLRKLAKKFGLSAVRVGVEVPRFKYSASEKTLRYYPDFYLPEQNRIIEVKSVFTLCGSDDIYDVVKRKRKAVIDAGYEFSLVLATTRKIIKMPDEWWRMSRTKLHSQLSSQ